MRGSFFSLGGILPRPVGAPPPRISSGGRSALPQPSRLRLLSPIRMELHRGGSEPREWGGSSSNDRSDSPPIQTKRGERTT